MNKPTHTIDTLYKYKNCLIRTFKNNIITIFTNTCSVSAIVFSIAEILKEIWELDIGYQIICSYWILVLIFIVILVIWKNWEKSEYSCFIRKNSIRTDTKITLRIGNIFDGSETIIVPVDSNFDTSTENGIVDIYSIQGQFQEKYFKHNIEKLNNQIKQGLNNNTKYDNQYSIGTICKIKSKKQQAYFFAAAYSDSKGMLNISSKEMNSALKTLWKNIKLLNNKEYLAIPLIWTGRTGISNAERNNIAKEIISSFIKETQEKKITENLVIVINPLDIEKKRVDWDDICKYLECKCYLGN